MRQTGFSLEDLRNHFDGKCLLPSYYHRCLLINEVGEIASINDHRSVEAQKVLVTLLTSDSRHDRWISIRHLINLENLFIATLETMTAIEEFQSKPENFDVLPALEDI